MPTPSGVAPGALFEIDERVSTNAEAPVYDAETAASTLAAALSTWFGVEQDLPYSKDGRVDPATFPVA